MLVKLTTALVVVTSTIRVPAAPALRCRDRETTAVSDIHQDTLEELHPVRPIHGVNTDSPIFIPRMRIVFAPVVALFVPHTLLSKALSTEIRPVRVLD